MRVNWNLIKISVLILILAGLYGFADYRRKNRKIKAVVIQFRGESDLYLTEEAVNKLLIQNSSDLKNATQEQVVLNTMEDVISSNPMVKDAQVYFSVDGKLITEIIQRKPIGRVETRYRFYIDDNGKQMPLSKYHSARVPIITGEITGKTLEDAYEILSYIYKDDFLRKNVIGIHIKEESDYQLKLRMDEFVVNLGSVENLGVKFKNFMAFYIKATKDKTLDNYAVVSLEFDNQVVCTKI